MKKKMSIWLKYGLHQYWRQGQQVLHSLVTKLNNSNCDKTQNFTIICWFAKTQNVLVVYPICQVWLNHHNF